MGRKRKDSTEDFDFDKVPAPESSVKQPDVLNPVMDALKDPKTLLAAALGVDPTMITDMLALQEQAKLFALAQETKERAQIFHSQQEEEYIKKQCGKSAKQRTQDVIESTWGKEKSPRWRVFHQKNPDLPWKPEPLDLEIPAASEAEARVRYMEVCGIRSTEHYIRAMPLKKFKAKLAEKDAVRDIEEEYRDEISEFQDGGFDSEVTEE